MPMASRLHRNFELLGAAIGDDDFVASHTNARVDKAGALLEAIGELEDPKWHSASCAPAPGTPASSTASAAHPQPPILMP